MHSLKILLGRKILIESNIVYWLHHLRGFYLLEHILLNVIWLWLVYVLGSKIYDKAKLQNTE